MKNVVGLTLPVLLLLFAACTAIDEDPLVAGAKQLNDRCPRMLDSETRIDAIEFHPPSALVYRFSLVRAQLATMDTARLRRELWPGLVSTVRLSPEMEIVRARGIEVQYHYKDKDGRNLLVLKVDPQYYR